ncbi:hypothetical protein [Bacillus cihuensis]|uniref:hypothetical protein n=1 Tax=Bacillus cihuensis TaxID=1208599 RepID=UPI0004082458|nr:hypothetical protein [Bacillus cihuensis]
MINKWLCCFVFTFSSLFFSVNEMTQAEGVNHPKQSKTVTYDPEMNCTRNTNLTAAQKKQLDTIYNRIYKDYIDLIEVYAWSGALTEDQKKLRYRMLNNYIKTFYKRDYKWCSEHESDEWEEEWYDNDED